MKYSLLSFLLTCIIIFDTQAQSKPIDTIVFGDEQSELGHKLKVYSSEVITGGFGEPARRLLPIGNNTEGGNLTFTMKINPKHQNYVTVRFWGNDIAHGNILILFCEGKQLGYRHLGDYDILDISNDERPFNDRFYYVTSPLPLHLTKGKKMIELSIRSTGPIWGYGETFERYQKPMIEPSKGIYKAYTHIETCFEPALDEKQGLAPKYDSVRTCPKEEILEQVKIRVNREIDKLLGNKNRPLSQFEMWFLAKAYHVKWTNAYLNDDIPDMLMFSIDDYYRRFLDSKELAYNDPSMSNPTWTTTGPIAISIRLLYNKFENNMEEEVVLGTTRRSAWSKLLQESVKYAKSNRRQYTNQSMIIDLFLYHCNRALMLIEPVNALPEFITLRYLYESIGLVPWLGIDTENGPQKPLGENFMQLTRKGLTKELGFVGYYGEVLDWIVSIYKATGTPGIVDSGDKKIREQLLKIMRARFNFRYPSLDNDGYRAMRAEAVIGWRDAGHYPGNLLYGDRGLGWDATPFQTAAATLDPWAIGVAQQTLEDNQFFEMVRQKIQQGGIRVTHALLDIPDEYELIRSQDVQHLKLPMTQSMPDYVFADEENGVVAIKNQDEILYASLYWRARYAINNLARVHYITPTIDRIATVFQKTEFTDSGMKYVRPNWVNLGFGGWREFYKGIESAHAGEVLSIAKIPNGVNYKQGEENIYAGKGDFYTLRYGKYIIGMNCTTDKSFDLNVPEVENGNVFDLTDGKELVKENVIKVSPLSTVVLFVNENCKM